MTSHRILGGQLHGKSWHSGGEGVGGVSSGKGEVLPGVSCTRGVGCSSLLELLRRPHFVWSRSSDRGAQPYILSRPTVEPRWLHTDLGCHSPSTCVFSLSFSLLPGRKPELHNQASGSVLRLSLLERASGEKGMNWLGGPSSGWT